MTDPKLCDACRKFMVDLLGQRIQKILEVYREEAAADSECNGDIGQSHCFHLMEIQRILEGKPTCGVYDDYGRRSLEVTEMAGDRS